jgi:hypothetical protein
MFGIIAAPTYLVGLALADGLHKLEPLLDPGALLLEIGALLLETGAPLLEIGALLLETGAATPELLLAR